LAYKLGRKEFASDGIKRIAAELIEGALKALKSKNSPHDEDVHTVRKHLKQVRAALRLVRYDVGEKLFRLENSIFRDVTRPLSELRDAAVTIETLTQLLQRPSCRVQPETFRSLRKALEERRLRVCRHALGHDAIQKAATTLQLALARTRRWPIEYKGWKAIQMGLRRSHEQGRQAMTKALQDGSDDAMHEWRKRVKYQYYHLEILRNCRKRVLAPLARQTHTLAECLGEHHDLAILKQLVDGELRNSLQEKQREILLELMAERQAKLQRKAAKLGRRLCAEEGKQFASRIHGYWQAWR
jgi:CHAD domain-containing protein